MDLTTSQLQDEILRLHAEVRHLEWANKMQRKQLDRYKKPEYNNLNKIKKLGEELLDVHLIDCEAFDELQRWISENK